ncbi:S8 family serine peptidase [Horticoccus sp. 23ND18S-11]|uniref:S8 family serine peptidase n=1 Tax=Horticoccus sp. 23ND18S-11 TaxID=3391832 RepID=UPI0039C9C630
MKNAFCRLLCGFVSLCTLAAAALQPPPPSEPFTAKEVAQGFRDGVLLVKPLPGRRASADADESREGLRTRRRWDRFGGLRLLEVPAGETVDRAVERLRASGRYEYVQVDTIRYASATPNDPNLNRQWPLTNSGANNGITGADIKAIEAWNVRTDASTVIVAVIDSGIRLDHPDIAANLWRNTREIPGNGRDDDGNGYIDDVNGINAITNTGNPNDDLGHGSHVAGIIGAVGNNALGMAGVAWRVQLMPLKFLRGDTGANAGRGVTSDAIECIEYAIANGAHIINASYGAAASSITQYDPAEFDAIRQARDAGILFVAAAGNDGANMDVVTGYPGGFRLENVISVANSNNRDEVSLSSNFGSGSVELFAPGSDIYSLSNDLASPYIVRSGTSMAAPHVTGALALLKAQFPADTYRQLVNRLLRSVDPVPAFVGKVQTGGRLNLDRALRSTDNRPFNDDFAARARIAGSNLAIRTVNTGATTESEPAIAGQAAGASLWWEWTAPTTSLVRLSTAGSTYDTVVGVFTGSTLASLTPIASNDNDGTRLTSRVEFTAQGGTTYQIVVGGKGGGTGLTLVDLGAVPANDNFASAESIFGPTVLLQATNAQATLETNEPQIRGRIGGRSLWYRWTAPATGRFQIGLSSGGFDPLLAVYTGSALNALTLVGSSDDYEEESGGTSANTSALVTVNAVGGTTYTIQVDGNARGGSPPTIAPFTLTLNDSLWQGFAGSSITCAPTIGPDGAVYVGSTDGFFHAFNADGTRRWPAIDLSSSSQDTSAAALAPDGTLYFGSGRNALQAGTARLRAYNSTTGAKKWEVVVGTGVNANNAVALGADGTIYVHSDEGRLFAYTDTGTTAQQKWSVAIPGTSYASVSIGADGTIYLGCDDPALTNPVHRLFALNPATGETKWSFPVDNPIYTAAAIDAAGNLYFGTLSSGRLYSVTPNGLQRWIYRGATLGTSSSPAFSPSGTTVYFAGYDGVLHAVDTTTGAPRWTFKLGKEVRASSPAVDANGVIYIGSYDGLIYAVNPDGTLKRTWSTGNIVRSSPAIAGRTLYIGSNDQQLYAFDIGTGTAGPWTQYRQNARRTGRASASTITLFASPVSQTAVLGFPLTLSVVAGGSGTLTYEWRKDGVLIPGATAASYTIATVTAGSAGSYSVAVTDTQGTVASAPAMITVEAGQPGQLTNLSVRTTAGSGEQTLAVGFVVAGAPTAAKNVLIRAIGPTLADFGVTGVLADPQLQLFSEGTVLASNDQWGVPAGGAAALANTFTGVGAFALRPDSLDAAILRAANPGVYSAQITGVTGSGIALAEVYDTNSGSGARLVNLSARAAVGTGSGVLIAGFTISGNVPKRVLIRGIGPTLTSFAVSGALPNPRLDLYRGTTVIESNDDWGGTPALSAAFSNVAAFALAANSRDAVLLVTLAPGSYTAQVSGVGATTGVALIEIYEMP